MSPLTYADTEYGVLYTLPGDLEERIDPVGSPSIGDELIRDLWLRHGVTGELVHRYVTPWEGA